MHKSNKFTLNEFFVLLLIVFTLSFHNLKYPLAIVQIVCSGFIFFNHYRNNAIDRNKLLYLVWGIGVIIIALFSCFWSFSISTAFSAVLSIIQVIMVGFALITYISDYKKINYVLLCLAIGSLVLCVRLVVQVPFDSWGTDRVGNYIGYGNNGASNVLSYTIISTFYLYYRLKNNKKSLLFIAFIALFAFFAFMCGSKKAIIIVLLGLGIQFLLNSKNLISTVRRLIIVGLFSTALVLFIMNYQPLYNVLGLRIEEMFDALFVEGEGDASTIDRIAFVDNAINVFKMHPFTGVGIDNFRFYNVNDYYAHNNYVELLADVGIIGFILYYWFITYVLINSFKLRKCYSKSFLITLIITILFMDIANVSYSLDSIQMFIAVAFGVICLEKKQCLCVDKGVGYNVLFETHPI